jgi:hypothetical protein
MCIIRGSGRTLEEELRALVLDAVGRGLQARQQRQLLVHRRLQVTHHRGANVSQSRLDLIELRGEVHSHMR